MDTNSVDILIGLTTSSFPDFQFQIMRPGFSIQKKMASASSAIAMNELVITNGRPHGWTITGPAASGWGLWDEMVMR